MTRFIVLYNDDNVIHRAVFKVSGNYVERVQCDHVAAKVFDSIDIPAVEFRNHSKPVPNNRVSFDVSESNISGDSIIDYLKKVATNFSTEVSYTINNEGVLESIQVQNTDKARVFFALGGTLDDIQ